MEKYNTGGFSCVKFFVFVELRVYFFVCLNLEGVFYFSLIPRVCQSMACLLGQELCDILENICAKTLLRGQRKIC